MSKNGKKHFNFLQTFFIVDGHFESRSFNEWIDDQGISDNYAMAFNELAKICLKHNLIKWKGKIFKQTSGLSIGNGFSPLAADIFMSKLESEASQEEWFPRIWFRNVDDVFSVIKKGTALEILKKLNERSPSIKFTYELEKEEKIPFLDLWIIENNDGKLSFDIYRKPQHVQLYIPVDSNHPWIHKKQLSIQ